MAYEINEAKELVIRAGLKCLKSGLIARTWGNISARISDEEFVITPSGKAYDTLTPHDIVTVRIDDCSYKGHVKPSSEKGVHAAAYRLRRQADFVIHTHQDYATAMSVFGGQFHVKSPKAADVLGPIVPTADYALSSTKALTKNLQECISDYPWSNAFLMKNHGTLCIGQNIAGAFAVARCLEAVCRGKYRSITGNEFPGEALSGRDLTDDAVILRREIHEEYDQRYRLFDNKKVGCVIEAHTPFIMKMSEYGKSMRAYVDDLAQIAGGRIPALGSRASDRKIARALNGVNAAVLIKNRGAICTGVTVDEAVAVMTVLEKGCQAALIAKVTGAGDPVAAPGAALEHAVYNAKYAKLKDKA